MCRTADHFLLFIFAVSSTIIICLLTWQYLKNQGARISSWSEVFFIVNVLVKYWIYCKMASQSIQAWFYISIFGFNMISVPKSKKFFRYAFECRKLCLCFFNYSLWIIMLRAFHLLIVGEDSSYSSSNSALGMEVSCPLTGSVYPLFITSFDSL